MGNWRLNEPNSTKVGFANFKPNQTACMQISQRFLSVL